MCASQTMWIAFCENSQGLQRTDLVGYSRRSSPSLILYSLVIRSRSSSGVLRWDRSWGVWVLRGVDLVMVTAQGGVEGSVRGRGGRGHGSPPVPPHRLEAVGVVLVAAQWHPGTLAATAKKSKTSVTKRSQFYIHQTWGWRLVKALRCPQDNVWKVHRKNIYFIFLCKFCVPCFYVDF